MSLHLAAIPQRARGSLGQRPQPSGLVSITPSNASLIDQVRTGRNLPSVGGQDLFGRRPSISTQSQLFGDWGYAGIFRREVTPYLPRTVPTPATPKTVAAPPPPPKKKVPGVRVPDKRKIPPKLVVPEISLEPGVPIETRPEVPPVSIHKSLLSTLSGALNSRLSSAINPAPRNIIAAAPTVVAAGVGLAGRVLPAIGRAIGSRTAGAAAAGVTVGGLIRGGGGQGVCAVGWHLNKQNGVGGPAGTYCVRNRRMNVGNARAARRSVRRLKGARKLLRDIEKMMPTRSTRRRAPAGHTTHLHHSGGS